MSPDGLDQLRAKREQARERRTPPPPRHPRPPADDTPTGSEQAVISASGKAGPARPPDAGISASEKSGAERAFSASGKAGRAPTPDAGISASRKSGAPVRRRGRPKGPLRFTLSVRIPAELDLRLSAEHDASGDGPQVIVERALDEYLSRRARQRARGATSSG